MVDSPKSFSDVLHEGIWEAATPAGGCVSEQCQGARLGLTGDSGANLDTSRYRELLCALEHEHTHLLQTLRAGVDRLGRAPDAEKPAKAAECNPPPQAPVSPRFADGWWTEIEGTGTWPEPAETEAEIVTTRNVGDCSACAKLDKSSPISPSAALMQRGFEDRASGFEEVDVAVLIDLMHDRSRQDHKSPSRENSHNSLIEWSYRVLNSPKFDKAVVFLIVMNTIVMAFDIQLAGLDAATQAGIVGNADSSGPNVAHYSGALFGLELFFTICFAIELLVRFLCTGGTDGAVMFLKSPMNWLDIIIVFVGIYGIANSDAQLKPQMLRLFRVAKIFRSIRLVGRGNFMSSMHLLNKSLRASIHVVAWSLLLLLLIQCIAAMVLCQIVQPHLTDPGTSLDGRKTLYEYYGTFTRSAITMFEVTLGNWGPPCRILMVHLHEAYASLFLVYRCVVGFAVLTVITAVFVQQTIKCAQADDEVMIIAQQNEKIRLTAKLRRFFEAVDTSGDGYISMAEFSAMLSRPEVALWLATLDVTPTDIRKLFEFIDNGDGQISIDEFIFGVSRLRGSARSVDIMEILMHLTKIQDLVVDVDSRIQSSRWIEESRALRPANSYESANTDASAARIRSKLRNEFVCRRRLHRFGHAQTFD